MPKELSKRVLDTSEIREINFYSTILMKYCKVSEETFCFIEEIKIFSSKTYFTALMKSSIRIAIFIDMHLNGK